MKWYYQEVAVEICKLVDDPDVQYLAKVFRSVPDLVERLARPHRTTLLHRLIEVECEIAFSTILDNYGVDELTDCLRGLLGGDHQDEIDPSPIIRQWIDQTLIDNWGNALFRQQSILCARLPLSTVTDRLFQHLFVDRPFLFGFARVLSNLVKLMKSADYPLHLRRDGVLKRVYLPEWLRRGIFFRDKGRCAECKKELRGVDSLAREHYDHLIPLASSGSNDPTNFQLLCEDCNLAKSTSEWVPTPVEVRFW